MKPVSTENSDQGVGRPIPFGPFVLERRIAVGGSAEVYLARPRVGSRPAPRFVVKRLLHQSDRGDALALLQREAELNQVVQHPNVVEVFGAGQVDGEPYLAMEYVDGVDLYRLLRRAEAERRRLPPELAAYVAGRIGEALAAVHAARDGNGQSLGIVHRDVTPSNVYLSSDGGLKLGDFGIARMAEPRARSPQAAAGLKGKLGYLAPEQIAAEPFDHRADLFALAAILGEMLIGERVFPGSGQLAVLLAIRDGNLEPLQRHQSEIPPPLYRVCLRGLARDPALRYQLASELVADLAPHELPSREELRAVLGTWVRWASDSSQLVQRLRGQIRDSVERMRAVRIAQKSHPPAKDVEPAPESQPLSEPCPAQVRLATGVALGRVTLPRLLEMIATGELRGEDQVALGGADFQCIREIQNLSRHLMPSTTAITANQFAVGVPDFHASLQDTSMLEQLARFRIAGETGALFVERANPDGTSRRKEIYLSAGRLLHVSTSEREELLGEYLIRRGAVTREELNRALVTVSATGSRLGDTLVSMGLVDAVDVFRAIRDQGRDRVAALCTWSRGLSTFYRGTAPGHVEFPLDLDLASPMMAGVFLLSQGDPRTLLPPLGEIVQAGPRAPSMASKRERGSAPLAVQALQRLATLGLSLQDCILQISQVSPQLGTRSISEKEAGAALVVGKFLGWITF